MKNTLLASALVAGLCIASPRVSAQSFSEISSTSVSHSWDDDHSTSYDNAYITSGDPLTFSSSTNTLSFTVSLPDAYRYDVVSSGGYQTMQIWLRFGDSINGNEVPGVNLSSFAFTDVTGTAPSVNSSKLYYDSSDGSISASLFFNSIPSDFSFTGVTFTFNSIMGLGIGTTALNTGTSSYMLGTTGSNGQFLTVSVPEPASYAAFLGIAGLGGMLMMRRRSKR